MFDDFFEDALGGSGHPSPQLKGVGDFVYGEVVGLAQRDYVKFGQEKPELDKNGNPVQQLVITLQTEHRNWANVTKVPKTDHADKNSPDLPGSEDDGKRNLYVPKGTNLHYAIGSALVAVKERAVKEGGKLGVKIVELKDTGKGNPLKVHEAKYEVPKAGSGEFFPTEDKKPEPAAPAATAPAPF